VKNKVSIALGSIAGALAIHAVLVACSPGARGWSVPDAQAQPVPVTQAAATACQNWKVSYFYAPNVASENYVANGANTYPGGMGKVVAIDRGWEPLGMLMWPGDTVGNTVPVGALVSVRHCADSD
jgi:hypothetical protein